MAYYKWAAFNSELMEFSSPSHRPHGTTFSHYEQRLIKYSYTSNFLVHNQFPDFFYFSLPHISFTFSPPLGLRNRYAVNLKGYFDTKKYILQCHNCITVSNCNLNP